MSKQPPSAPTASAKGHCPTVIQIVGRPGTGSLPSTLAPPTMHDIKSVPNAQAIIFDYCQLTIPKEVAEMVRPTCLDDSGVVVLLLSNL